MSYSGKKKRYTQKTLLVVNKITKQIICTAFDSGRKHDFKVYKESKIHVSPKTLSITDSGFVGIDKIHPNSLLPLKKTKKRPLSDQDKYYNRVISILRVANENVIASIKKFRIISEKYRNRGRRFGLRFNLICGIYNYELII